MFITDGKRLFFNLLLDRNVDILSIEHEQLRSFDGSLSNLEDFVADLMVFDSEFGKSDSGDGELDIRLHFLLSSERTLYFSCRICEQLIA